MQIGTPSEELTTNEKSRIWTEILLLIGFVTIPALVSLFLPSSPHSLSLHQDGVWRLTTYLPVCGLVFYFMRRSARDNAFFGLAKNRDFLGVLTFIGGLVVVGMFCIWVSEMVRQSVSPGSPAPDISNLMPVPRSMLDWIFMLPILYIGAAFEELDFRGYIAPPLLEATGNKWLAILIPSVAFGSYHIY